MIRHSLEMRKGKLMPLCEAGGPVLFHTARGWSILRHGCRPSTDHHHHQSAARAGLGDDVLQEEPGVTLHKFLMEVLAGWTPDKHQAIASK